MARIFLSYSREDRACAERLVRVLEGASHEVWWDRHIDGGEEFANQIEAALEKADAVLVAWSEHSIRSRWVRDEASIGGDSGKLLPISIDGSLPPMGFRQFHTLDLKGWKGTKGDKRTSELLRSIQGRSKGRNEPPEHVAASSPLRKSPRFFGRPLRIIAASFGLLVVLATAYFVINHAPQTSEGSKPTLAILPFTFTSSDPTLKSLASQARDSTAHTLSDTGMPIRLIDSVPSHDSEANYFMFGEFSSSKDKIVATLRLEDALHRITVWSRRFELDQKESEILPDRIGAQVAGTLGWAGTVRILVQGEVADPNLTADLLRQEDLTGDAIQAYQISQRLASKWQESAMAQLGVAFYTAFALDQIPREQRSEAVATARRALELAQALAPDFGDVHIPGCLLQSSARIAQCEKELRVGMLVDPDAPFVTTFLGRLLWGVGRSAEGDKLIKLAYAHDAYMPVKIANMIRVLASNGEDSEAIKLYRRADAWWPESDLFRSVLQGLIDRGDFKAIVKVRDQLGPNEFPTQYFGIVEVASAASSNSLGALKLSCASDAGSMKIAECMLTLAKLGDMNGAYAQADKLYPARTAKTQIEQDQIWLDDPDTAPLDYITSASASALRHDQRFLLLAQRVGLIDYWRSGKLPDFCHNKPEAICAQIKRF